MRVQLRLQGKALGTVIWVRCGARLSSGLATTSRLPLRFLPALRAARVASRSSLDM